MSDQSLILVPSSSQLVVSHHNNTNNVISNSSNAALILHRETVSDRIFDPSTLVFNAMSAIKQSVSSSNEKTNEISILRRQVKEGNQEREILRNTIEVLQALLPDDQAQDIEDSIEVKKLQLRRKHALDMLEGQLEKVQKQIKLYKDKENDFKEQINKIKIDPNYDPQ